MTDPTPSPEPAPDAQPRRDADVLPFGDLARLSAFQRLLEQRIVFLKGEISEATADDLIANLLALDADSHERITLYVDSPGGSVTGTFAIYDTMRMITSDVDTRCVGMAASGGAVVLGTGTGTRSATPNARIMLHQPHGGLRGTASDITIAAQEFGWLRERMYEVLSASTGQTVERLRQDMDRDRWMSAAQARDYGMIDEVVGRPALVTASEGTTATPS